MQVEKDSGNIYLDMGCDYWVQGIWYQGWHSHTILWDLLLETYIDRDLKPPTPADPQKVTNMEKEAAKKWCEGETKARTHIELTVGDSEMVHSLAR